MRLIALAGELLLGASLPSAPPRAASTGLSDGGSAAPCRPPAGRRRRGRRRELEHLRRLNLDFERHEGRLCQSSQIRPVAGARRGDRAHGLGGALGVRRRSSALCLPIESTRRSRVTAGPGSDQKVRPDRDAVDHERHDAGTPVVHPGERARERVLHATDRIGRADDRPARRASWASRWRRAARPRTRSAPRRRGSSPPR